MRCGRAVREDCDRTVENYVLKMEGMFSMSWHRLKNPDSMFVDGMCRYVKTIGGGED